MPVIYLRENVFHEPIGWLKFVASVNIWRISLTLETSHEPIGALNAVLYKNIPLISVIPDVHVVSSPGEFASSSGRYLVPIPFRVHDPCCQVLCRRKHDCDSVRIQVEIGLCHAPHRVTSTCCDLAPWPVLAFMLVRIVEIMILSSSHQAKKYLEYFLNWLIDSSSASKDGM